MADPRSPRPLLGLARLIVNVRERRRQRAAAEAPPRPAPDREAAPHA